MISVVYAGAGGGKTTSMVDAVCEKVPLLKSHRFLCVITYTNDAARNIRESSLSVYNRLDNLPKKLVSISQGGRKSL